GDDSFPFFCLLSFMSTSSVGPFNQVLGKLSTNSEPWSTLLETVTLPPCASTTALTRLKPRPSPRWERLLSPRYRRAQILSCSSGGIPIPVSQNVAMASSGLH